MLKSVSFKQWILGCVLLCVASALGSRPLFSMLSVQPYLILITLVVLAFYVTRASQYLPLVVVAALLARQTPEFFDLLSYATLALGVIIWWIKDRLVWPDRLGVGVTTVCAIALIHLCVSGRFIVYEFGAFMLELVISLIMALVLYEVLSVVYRYSEE